MPDQKIFCNTPWYELHIYWDGSLGICCQEDHKLYSSGEQYNIACMSIADWFNSEPVRNFRQQILGDTPVSACRRGYHEEQLGANSRRLRSNQKSAIFTQAFLPALNKVLEENILLHQVLPAHILWTYISILATIVILLVKCVAHKHPV